MDIETIFNIKIVQALPKLERNRKKESSKQCVAIATSGIFRTVSSI